jgi:hypothetical protein
MIFPAAFTVKRSANARAQPREPLSRRSAAKAERGSSRLQRVDND